MTCDAGKKMLPRRHDTQGGSTSSKAHVLLQHKEHCHTGGGGSGGGGGGGSYLNT